MEIYAPLTSEPRPELQRIEVATSFQLPGLHVIGLPAPEVSEARERIRAALESSGFELPKRRVVLNLAPASIRKRGTGLDLAMALALLSLNTDDDGPSDHLPPEKIAAWGEVGLDGGIKPAGQLTRSIYSAWENGVSRFFLSAEELDDALRISEWIEKAGFFSSSPPTLIGASTLAQCWSFLRSSRSDRASRTLRTSEPEGASLPSQEKMSEETMSAHLMVLSPALERAICIAAVGSHHLLLLGPKGTGKSHALEWLIALQPETSHRMKVNHLLLMEMSQGRAELHYDTPIRRVGPSARPSALLGTSQPHGVRPGEFSLAHGGLLIADEFPEWSRDSREALREPLERGLVTLTRAKQSVELPARFAFAANGNLCPCGGWPAEFPVPLEIERRRVPRCRCGHSRRKTYISRLSGPLLDRLDLVLLVGSAPPESSVGVSARLRKLRTLTLLARHRAIESWGASPAELTSARIEALLDRHASWRKALEQLQQGSLRARHKTVRVALSLAAWDGSQEPQPGHFMEASCYRPERFGLCE